MEDSNWTPEVVCPALQKMAYASRVVSCSTTFSSNGRFAVRSDAAVARTKTAAIPTHPIVHRFDKKARRCALPCRMFVRTWSRVRRTASNVRNDRAVPYRMTWTGFDRGDQSGGGAFGEGSRPGRTPRGGDTVLGDACHVHGHVMEMWTGPVRPPTPALHRERKEDALRVRKQDSKAKGIGRMPSCQLPDEGTTACAKQRSPLTSIMSMCFLRSKQQSQ